MKQYDIDILKKCLELIENHLKRENEHLMPPYAPDVDKDYYYPCWVGALKAVLQIIKLDLEGILRSELAEKEEKNATESTGCESESEQNVSL